MPAADATIRAVYTKEDGSLGICFFWHNKWHITTRGSLNSDIGYAAARILERLGGIPDGINRNTTLLFEIVCPLNRVVVDYGGYSALYFIGSRSPLTGDSCFDARTVTDFSWKHFAQRWDFYSTSKMREWMDTKKGTEFEGFVVHYSDGTIFKWKSADYIRIHKDAAKLTPKSVLRAMQDGAVEDARIKIAEELLDIFDRYMGAIENHVYSKASHLLVFHLQQILDNAPDASMKEFAQYVQANLDKQFHKYAYGVYKAGIGKHKNFGFSNEGTQWLSDKVLQECEIADVDFKL